MKDPGSVVSSDTGNSSASSRVTSSPESDDDYIFTEDQRRAALELQSLYRKLGLEDLDDGFEEGLSAYDDPHFDIVARLQEVNTRFEEDETPLESDRNRKVRFKETVVDLVVPISPVRSSFIPPDFDYGDYDDDYDDEDFEVEDLQDMMADEEQGRLSDDEEVKTNSEEVRSSDKEVKQALQEDRPSEEVDKSSWDPSQDDNRPRSRIDNDGNNETITVGDDEPSGEPSAPPLIFLQNGFHSEEDEKIHIRELDESADDSDRSNCSSPEKMLKLETDKDGESLATEEPIPKSEVLETESGRLNLEVMPAEVEATRTETDVTEADQKATQVQSSEPPLGKERDAKPKDSDCATEDNDSNGLAPETKACKPTKNEQTKAKSLPASVKPKKPLREISPPTRTRTSVKKPSALPPKTFPVVDVNQNQSAAVSKSGNSRSRYGLTEELREELRRLKKMEASQKKLREHEQAEERRRRQEDAESAFRAWLDLKKTTTGKGPKPAEPVNAGSCRSPTRKPTQCSGGQQQQQDGVSNEEAFRAWLEQKHRQERRERLLQQLQRQHEAAGDPRRRDTSRKAYRVWLRRKNGQRRQTLSGQQGATGLSSLSTLPQGLPRALQQAEMLNRTYQAYFGSSLWASLAGLKRHPATLI